ncbi:DUF2059 domain-containing protein [Fodinibius saliphilus]|uniref:DUF2059 domain-containing protein n=1 Tax=Fodinibius saliphilus TaxID=1920650 RepID=UPI001109E331|nr:DUF2059 domain-containing protein [Fodinibius saliphilus]
MKKILLTVFLFIFSATAFAQIDSHMQAVNELMEVMHMKEQITESADRMLKLQVQASPQMAQHQDIMSDFFHKYINWKNIGDDIKKVYKETFTEDEIRELTAFYNSDIGQKYARLTPTITEETAKITQGVIKDHQMELQQKIMRNMQGN